MSDDVDGRNARPVEKAFGDPVVARGVALGIFPRRNLRHVYNDFERRPLGRVRKIRRCLNESRADGIAKISRSGAGCRPDYVVVLQQFTDHDLHARAPKRLRAAESDPFSWLFSAFRSSISLSRETETWFPMTPA